MLFEAVIDNIIDRISQNLKIVIYSSHFDPTFELCALTLEHFYAICLTRLLKLLTSVPSDQLNIHEVSNTL